MQEERQSRRRTLQRVLTVHFQGAHTEVINRWRHSEFRFAESRVFVQEREKQQRKALEEELEVVCNTL